MTHGATPITGSPTCYANNEIIVRLGDLVYCPIHGHGINPIVTVMAPNRESDGKPVAQVTAIAQCGAIIISGSPNVYV